MSWSTVNVRNSGLACGRQRVAALGPGFDLVEVPLLDVHARRDAEGEARPPVEKVLLFLDDAGVAQHTDGRVVANFEAPVFDCNV